MKVYHSYLLLLGVSSALAALNGPCSVSGASGTCISTADCKASGGQSAVGFCPDDPYDIRCCTGGSDSTYASSGATYAGSSATYTGSGATYTGSTESPSATKTASTTQTKGRRVPFGTSSCQQKTVSGGNTILNQFPNIVKEVGCFRSGPGEHGQGRALDLMVGAYNKNGQSIAEWAMDHHKELGIYYIIWGQRIWNADIDQVPMQWASWRTMKDRGSVTQNHWDHPHISFYA